MTLRAIVALVAVVACAACSEQIDRAEADRIAHAEFERYAREKGHAIDRYSRPVVQEQPPYWLYIYQYSVPPKHELVVTVDQWGNAELSWLADDGGVAAK